MNIAQSAPRGSRARVSADSAWPLVGANGEPFHARGMSARRAKTAKRVEGVARQPGPQDAPKFQSMEEDQGFWNRLRRIWR